jgi:hypothetical protein
MRLRAAPQPKILLVIGLCATTLIALLVVLAQCFGAAAGRGVAEQLGRIGRADVRTAKFPNGSIVSYGGVTVAALDDIQIIRVTPDSDSASFYVRGRWVSSVTASRIQADSGYIALTDSPFTLDHPWRVQLEKRSIAGLRLVGLMRLLPDSSVFPLYEDR